MSEKEKRSNEASNEAQTPGPHVSPSTTHKISSARLNIIIVGLWLCLFVSAMDTTIITTSLVRISSDFNNFNQSGWLVVAYLLTDNSFLLITGKLSDVWGLKVLLLACSFFFLVFSMACGAAQTMTQLIVFRAFQGIGGSGLYSLTFVTIMKLSTPEQLGFYSGVISSVFAFSNLLGPLLGGIITDNTTWRWIFFINGPIVGTAIVILVTAMPRLVDGKSNRDRMRGFDFIGGILSVGWSIPLIFALQEGGNQYDWDTGPIIGTFSGGLAVLVVFGLHQAYISYRTKKEPIFPVNFLSNPAVCLLYLSIFLTGSMMYVSVIELPQRFQAVNGTSASRAGVLLLTLTLLSPVGAMFAGMTMARFIAAEYLLVVSSTLSIIGMGLLSSLPVGHPIPASVFGFEVIIGLGMGLAGPPFYYLIGTLVEEKDIATATSALNMLRILGGCVGVAICSAILHSDLRSHLRAFLDPTQIEALSKSIESLVNLPASVQRQVSDVYGHSYNKQFRVMVYFAAANLLVNTALIVVRKRNGTFNMKIDRKDGNEFQTVEQKSAQQHGSDKEVVEDQTSRVPMTSQEVNLDPEEKRD